MKLSIIFCLGVAVWTRPIVAQEEPKDTDEFLELPETHQDFARALKALFVEGDPIDEEHFGDEDEDKESLTETGRSFRQDQTKERGQVVTDPSVITRYNRFLDAVFQRANKALTSKNLDTLYINFKEAKQRLKKVEAKQLAKKKRNPTEAPIQAPESSSVKQLTTNKVVSAGSAGSVGSVGGGSSTSQGMKVVYVSSGGSSLSPLNSTFTEGGSRLSQIVLGPASRPGVLRTSKAKKGRNDKTKAKPQLVVSMKGISSFRRSKDVKVKNYPTHKKTLTMFEFGPVDITFTKQFGKAKRSIDSHVEQFKGRLVILLNPDGTATIQDFKIFAPRNIQVRSDSNKGMDKVFNKQKGLLPPLAALRLRSIFRSVLDS